jgi:hypothetical protein
MPKENQHNLKSKKIMITQFLNNIKKTPINLFPLYCMENNYMREKKNNY